MNWLILHHRIPGQPHHHWSPWSKTGFPWLFHRHGGRIQKRGVVAEKEKETKKEKLEKPGKVRECSKWQQKNEAFMAVGLLFQSQLWATCSRLKLGVVPRRWTWFLANHTTSSARKLLFFRISNMFQSVWEAVVTKGFQCQEVCYVSFWKFQVLFGILRYRFSSGHGWIRFFKGKGFHGTMRCRESVVFRVIFFWYVRPSGLPQ